MRLLSLSLRLVELNELRIEVVLVFEFGVLNLIRVRYDMTMYQPCDVVPSHAQSRGHTGIFAMYK